MKVGTTHGTQHMSKETALVPAPRQGTGGSSRDPRVCRLAGRLWRR